LTQEELVTLIENVADARLPPATPHLDYATRQGDGARLVRVVVNGKPRHTKVATVQANGVLEVLYDGGMDPALQVLADLDFEIVERGANHRYRHVSRNGHLGTDREEALRGLIRSAMAANADLQAVAPLHPPA
jgi:hypothetical protein